jgi:uncharacterized SAM-dependent methyltransferase
MNEGEVSLFDDIAKYISSSEPKSIFNIVDIGSGNGMKGKLFIESIGESTVKAYYPIDLQIIELEFALNVHRDGKYAKHPVFLDLENMGARFPVKTTPGEKNINIFLGGTYGNFDHHTINQNLKKLINNQDYLLVTMSISAGTKSDEELIAPYMNMNAQKISLGTLEQIGFNANQFETNKDYPELVLHYKMENRRATSFFILKDDVEIDGKKYSKGTEFKILSSWKPNLDEFKSALETDFVVEKMFYNDVNAIALIKNLK